MDKINKFICYIVGLGLFEATFIFVTIPNVLMYKKNCSRNNCHYDTIVVYNHKKMVIISAGQSNIDGRNMYSKYPFLDNNPNVSIQICNNDNGLYDDFYVNESDDGYDWAFDAIAYNLITSPKYGHLKDLYVIKKSMGGTSIDPLGMSEYHWTADIGNLQDKKYSLLEMFKSRIHNAMSGCYEEREIAVMLWHQGEGDSVTEQVALRYYDNLKRLISDVRTFVGNDSLPVISATISHKSEQYNKHIEDAMYRLAREDHNFHLIDMSKASLKDAYHFNEDWSVYLGKCVYNRMVDIGLIYGSRIHAEEPIK